MIEGISHITFVVHDLEKTAVFFQTIFDAKEVYSSGDRKFSIAREKFFMVGQVWIALMEGTPEQNKSYNHIAFKFSEADYDLYLERIKTLGIESKPLRPRVTGEGRSLYFYDYDNHLFELHTGTLQERLESYATELREAS
jgi:catechol 2,3-dioxygenase-like lactoylglutathione lyase family enzyme